jgi:hypothetical protein
MTGFIHKVAGIYPDEGAAQAAYEQLSKAGFEEAELACLTPGGRSIAGKLEPERRRVKGHFVRNLLIGAVVGVIIGVVIPAAAMAFGIAFAGDQPVRLLGWGVIYGATIGAVIGGLLGFKPQEGMLAGEIQDQIHRASYAVLIHTKKKDQMARAREILQASDPKEILSY